MKIADNILLRYLYLFYPYNKVWLKCNNIWDIDFCMCVDEVELNIGVLLYNILAQNNELKYSFEFRDYEKNSYYPMKISAWVPPSTGVATSCKLCSELELFRTIKSDDFETIKKRLKSDMEINYEIKFPEFFIASCLYKVNNDETLKRSDIIKYLFLKKPSIFLTYIEKFAEFVESENINSKEFIKVHLDLIASVLVFFAEKKDSNILGDVLDVFDEERFQYNYNLIGREGNLKEITYEKLSSLVTCQLPKFNLRKYNINKFERLVRIIDINIKDNIFLETYFTIYKNLQKIVENQSRQNDTAIKTAMDSFLKYINNS